MKALCLSLLVFLYIGLHSTELPFTFVVTFGYDEAGNRVVRAVSVKELKTLDDVSHDILEKFAIVDNSDVDFSFENTKVYPNPVNLFLNIEISKKLDSKSTSYIYDINGRLVGQIESDDSTYKIDMRSYKPGSYILILSYQENNLHYKIIKQ